MANKGLTEGGKYALEHPNEKLVVRAKGDMIGYYGKYKHARRRYGPQRQHPEAGDPFVVLGKEYSETWMERVVPAKHADGSQMVHAGKPVFITLEKAPAVVVAEPIVKETAEEIKEQEQAELLRVANEKAKPAAAAGRK